MNFSGRGACIFSRIQWVAQNCIGNKYLRSGQSGMLEKKIEVFSGAVPGEGNTGSPGSEAAGSFGYEQDIRVQGAISQA